MINDVYTENVKNYSFNEKEYKFQNNLFQFLGLSQDSKEYLYILYIMNT